MDAAYGVVHLWDRHDNCGGSAVQAESGISRLYGNDVLFQYVGHMAVKRDAVFSRAPALFYGTGRYVPLISCEGPGTFLLPFALFDSGVLL